MLTPTSELLLSATSESSVVVFEQGANGYFGISDTMLRESRPTKQYAGGVTVNVDGADSAGLANQGLLYFGDIFGDQPWQVPLGATITSATLTLNVTDATTDTFGLYRMLTDWTLLPSWSWNSLGGGIRADGSEALQIADTIVNGIQKGQQQIDVTSSLQAWSSGADNYGWALLMDGSNGWGFTASEGSISPRLTVQYSFAQSGLLIADTDGSTVVREGGAGDTISVALTGAPSSSVTVFITGDTDVDALPVSLTFDAQNWAEAQIVNISAIDDDLVEGQERKSLSFLTSSSDPNYDGTTVSIDVIVQDNESAAPPPVVDLSVVAIRDTTQYKLGDPSGYGSGDPSGLAYVPALNLIFIADSEHDESPYHSPTNLFAVRPDGTQVGSYSLSSFTIEPTGLAYNPYNGLLYISDDDKGKIFWVDPTNPQMKLGEYDVTRFGIQDAEDPVFDPVTGNMYLLDGITTRLFELTAGGDLVASFDLPSIITDAEGLAYDATRDVFFVGSGATRGAIFMIDRSGTLLAEFDQLNEFRNPVTGGKPKIKGLEFAPSSDPNDGDQLSLYVADYGSDQVSDGRLFEVALLTDILVS